MWHSPKKSSITLLPYVGITHIRLKGRSSITSSQPAHTSSPEYNFKNHITASFACQAKRSERDG
jgi:hypothetical protein